MMLDSSYESQVTLISGGVGGAKLVRGFDKIFDGRYLKVIANTGDDAVFYGLHVSPDLDTVMYTLAGLLDPEKGWGIKGDSFYALLQLAHYGEPDWFKLGDKDLATHILRTKMLREGLSLTEVTLELSRRLGIQATLLPMTDQRVETFIKSDKGSMPFQEYFVRMQQKVNLRGVAFKGIRKAQCTHMVKSAILDADLIVLAPSNPIVSILPVLRVHPIRHLIKCSKAVKVAVSPFIGKRAVSGPAKELMESQGYEGSSYGLACFYSSFVDVLVIDYTDYQEKDLIEKVGVSVTLTDILIRNMNDSIRLAKEIFAVFKEHVNLRP